MDMIVFLFLAILLGVLISSAAFAYIARGLGFKPSETLNPVYRTTGDLMNRNNQKLILSGSEVRHTGFKAVQILNYPSSSLPYTIFPKGDRLRSTNLHHETKTHEYAASRRKYPIPANELFKEDI